MFFNYYFQCDIFDHKLIYKSSSCFKSFGFETQDSRFDALLETHGSSSNDIGSLGNIK